MQLSWFAIVFWPLLALPANEDSPSYCSRKPKSLIWISSSFRFESPSVTSIPFGFSIAVMTSLKSVVQKLVSPTVFSKETTWENVLVAHGRFQSWDQFPHPVLLCQVLCGAAQPDTKALKTEPAKQAVQTWGGPMPGQHAYLGKGDTCPLLLRCLWLLPQHPQEDAGVAILLPLLPWGAGTLGLGCKALHEQYRPFHRTAF